MYLEHTNYHRLLRVLSLVFAVVLIFESGLFNESTARLSEGTEVYLANAIGMSATVQPTELNKYTAALTAKEQELKAREAALSQREISVGISGEASRDMSTYILATILFILLLLILLNYVLDYLRSREELEAKTV